MNDDNDFKPRLGKIRSLGSKRGRSYVNRVIRALALAGGRPTRGKSKFKICAFVLNGNLIISCA